MHITFSSELFEFLYKNPTLLRRDLHFASCSLWVWKFDSHNESIAQTGGALERGAKKNLSQRGSHGILENI
jgi:hypothetical protein